MSEVSRIPESQDMDAGLAPTFYSAMRDELMQRLGLRDRALTLGVSVVAGILGLGVSTTGPFPNWALLTMPIVAVGATSLVLDHSRMIASVAEYLHVECARYINRRGEEVWAPWELSWQLRKARASEYSLRMWAEISLMGIPCLMAALFGAPGLLGRGRSTLDVACWIVSLVGGLGILWSVVSHYRWRTKFHRYRSARDVVAVARADAELGRAEQ